MTFKQSMRSLHRYLGFFVAGLMLVYAISGIVLLMRDTGFMQTETTIEKTLPGGMKGEQIGEALHERHLEIKDETPTKVTFKGGGEYDKTTGKVSYVKEDVIFPFNKLISLHKLSTKTPFVVIGMVGAVALLLLVITSFFMFSTNTRMFKRGMAWAIAGIVITLAALFLM